MAQIKTGTVSVTNGSNVVTGVGTTWLTDGVQAGDGFLIQSSSGIDGAGVYYTVGGSVTETGLQLASNWAGETASGVAYVIAPDFIAPGYPLLLPGDLEAKPLINQNVQKLLNDKAPAVVTTISGTQTVAETFNQIIRDADLEPFDNRATTVRYADPTYGVYRGLNVAQFYVGPNSETVYLWREAPGHGIENSGTSIKASITRDYGYTFGRPDGPGNSGVEHTLVFRQADVDTRNFASGNMGSGRIGVMAARVEPSAAHQDPVFLYSDDGGVNWSDTIVSSVVSTTHNFHSNIIPWPTSAGGDDAGGFVCYYYESDGSAIGALSTTDNGATWTDNVDLITPGAFPSVTEMSVARVGSEDKWVMVIRTGSGSNAAVSTSTDLLTWTSITDTGLILGSNPPEIFYSSSDEKIWFLGFSRQDKPLVTEYENAIVTTSADASELYDSNGATGFSGWSVLTALEFWPTGYASVKQIGGRWYALFTIEDYAGSTQSTTGSLAVLSQDKLVTQSPKQSGENLLVNGSLRQWPLGTTITGTTRAAVVPGFTFARSSSVGGWTITRETGEIPSPYSMRIQRDDGNTATNDMILVANIPLLASRPCANEQVTVSFKAKKAGGFSSASDLLTVQLRQTDNTSEQAITGATGTFPVGDAPVGTSTSNVTLENNWQRFVLSPGRVDKDTWQLSLRILWTPTGTALNDYIDIQELKVEIGSRPTPFEFIDVNQEKDSSDRYAQRFVVITPASTTSYYLFPSGEMKTAPIVSVDTGSVVGSPSAHGLRINNATGGNLTTTVTAGCVF